MTKKAVPKKKGLAQKKAVLKTGRSLPGPRPEHREQDVVTELSVQLRGFGHPEKVKRDHVLRVSRRLYLEFGDSFTLSINGHPVKYDHLADDGHDSTHTKILDTEEEMEEAVAAAGTNSGGGD